MTSLFELGFNEDLQEHRQEAGLESFDIGRVSSEHRDRYTVITPDGEFEGEIIGNLRYTAESRLDFPAVGDWVAVSRYDDNKVLIHAVYPRSTMIQRQSVGTHSEKQIIATNIDAAFILQSVDRDFSINRIERYLTICADAGVDSIIVLNKIDLIEKEEQFEMIKNIEKRVKDVPIIAMSNVSQDGHDEVKKLVKAGMTYCLLGSSGVGKSTLVNCLVNKEKMDTDYISDSTNRGKHVTSHREMVLLEQGGIMIDNPGMREVGIADAKDGLEKTFDQIMSLAADCRYNDCTHTNESGCAVFEAVESGEVDLMTYENFLKMERERDHYESSVAERRRKEKSFGKMVKEIMKEKKKNRF